MSGADPKVCAERLRDLADRVAIGAVHELERSERASVATSLRCWAADLCDGTRTAAGLAPVLRDWIKSAQKGRAFVWALAAQILEAK